MSTVTDRRSELLDSAVQWVFANGFAELSLRPLATALKTSDRMLLYYFETKEQLVSEIAISAANTLVTLMPSGGPTKSAKSWLDSCWTLYTDDSVRSAMLLLFELDVLGARNPEAFGAATTQVADMWIANVHDSLGALGVSGRNRRAVSKVVAAALVGLVLDTLVRNDSKRPTAELAVLAGLIEGR